jgi:hypothetical protein
MDMSIRFGSEHIRRLFYWLVAFECLLVLAFLAEYAIQSPAWLIKRLLDLDREDSIATWFSSMQLAAIGVLFLIKLVARKRGDVPRWFLGLGCLGFFFVSADEALMLHENITSALVKVDWVPRFSGDHGVWVFFYLGLGALLLLLTLRPLLMLWQRHRYALTLMTAGAGVFLLGAVGLEVIGYEFLAGGPPVIYLFEVAAEEFLEMLGATAILCGASFYVLESEQRSAGTADGSLLSAEQQHVHAA